ncbi:MAG: hypothetical protein AAGE94_07550 [Acidobacteriota bacterium]
MGQHIDRTQKHPFPLIRLAMAVALASLCCATVAVADDATARPAEAEPASIWDDVSSWLGGDDEESAETTDEAEGESDTWDSEEDWWTEGEEGEWVEGSDGAWEWVPAGGGGGGGGGSAVVIDITTQPAGDEPLGYICYRDGREKPILPSDALWLAKMVHGETRGNPTQDDADHMLWTIASRTDLPSFRDKSVQYLTRNYSQPINRKWTRTGSRCKEYYEDDFEGDVPKSCSEANTKRRARYIAMGWDDIDELARRATLEFAVGQVPNPLIGSIGWFDSGQWKESEKGGHNGNRQKLAVVERNTFYARKRGPATVHWDQWDVSVVPADHFCPDFVGDEVAESAEEVSE